VIVDYEWIHFNTYLIEVVLAYILYLYIITIETQRGCLTWKLGPDTYFGPWEFESGKLSIWPLFVQLRYRNTSEQP
jgi:hypothetical protein